jgi:hypothetical protein
MANYSDIEWRVDGAIQENTHSAFTVKTDASPFNSEGTYTLAVTGTHIGGSGTTSVHIEVEKPEAEKPQLKNEDTGDDLGEGDTVEVTMGDTVTFSLKNFSDYSLRQWDSGTTYLGIGLFCVVSTTITPFNVEGKIPLTFTGTNSAGKSNTTTIKINVTKPDADEPKLKNMDTGNYLGEGDTVYVTMGEIITISLENFSDYINRQWKSNVTELGTLTYCIVSTEADPFNVEGSIPLTFTGTTRLMDSVSKTIYINVSKPQVPDLELKNNNTGNMMADNGDAEVTIGSPLTFSIENFIQYQTIEWFIDDDTTADARGSVYTVNTNIPPNNKARTFKLTVKGTKYDNSKEMTINISIKEPPEYKWVPHKDADKIKEWIDGGAPIDDLEDNKANTGGNVAWYKTYSNTTEGRAAFWSDHDNIVVPFMEEVNDYALWPITDEIAVAPNTYQIYLRYDDQNAIIRITKGTGIRYIYTLSLGFYDWVYPDDPADDP